MEIKLVIFHMLKRYSLSLLDNVIPYPRLAVTMHPGKKIRLQFKKLESACLVERDVSV